jgi:hypothetical protein
MLMSNHGYLRIFTPFTPFSCGKIFDVASLTSITPGNPPRASNEDE